MSCIPLFNLSNSSISQSTLATPSEKEILCLSQRKLSKWKVVWFGRRMWAFHIPKLKPNEECSTTGYWPTGKLHSLHLLQVLQCSKRLLWIPTTANLQGPTSWQRACFYIENTSVTWNTTDSVPCVANGCCLQDSCRRWDSTRTLETAD